PGTAVICGGNRMPAKTPHPERPISVQFTDADVVVTLANGEVIANPLRWHAWLANASDAQRQAVILHTYAVEWPELDEGLDIEGMRQGIPSDPLPEGA